MNKVGQLTDVSKYYPSTLQVFKSTLLGSKNFLSNPVLYPLTLSIHKSEVLGIIGSNGAGKSTLLKLISGILKPSTGNIQLKGRVASLLELGSGFNPNFTGRENILTYSKVLGFSQTKITKEMDDILDFSGLSDHIDKPLRTYSSGMVARLAFTVASKVEPDIIIIDEALAVGDAQFRQKSFNKIKTLQQKGVTLIFCSHSLYQIELLSTNVLWLEKGHVNFYGEPQEAVHKYRDFLATKQSISTQNSHPKANANLSFIKKIDFYKNSYLLKENEHLNSERDSLRIDVKFKLTDEFKNASVSISFNLTDGPMICGIGSFEDSIAPNIKNGNGSITLNLKKINLLKGTYSVNINLMNKEGTVCLDSIPNARVIKVKQNSLKQGFVSLNHSWSN